MDAELSSHLIEFAIDEVIRHFETFANQERQIRRVRHKSLKATTTFSHNEIVPSREQKKEVPLEQ